MRRNQSVVCGCLALALVAWVGCGSEEPASQDSTTNQNQSDDQVAQSDVDSRLLGVWLGTATIDRERLQSKMETLSETERQQVQPLVESYLSTVMAMQFDDRGAVENDVEMKIQGKTIRESSVGVYRIVGRTADSVEIEVREQLEDGTQLTTRKVIRFDPSGKTMEFDVPLGETLNGVGARLVFERQVMESVASEPGSSSQQDIRR